jgi:Holliday junction resolvase RusA-like endonuclease
MIHLIAEGWPLSKKNTWAIGRTRLGKSFMYQKDKGFKAYQFSCRAQMALQMHQKKWSKFASPAKLCVEMDVYFHSKQNRMDVHNAVETMLDIMQGVVYDNDNQVVGIHTPPIRLVDDEKPRIEMYVMTTDEALRAQEAK